MSMIWLQIKISLDKSYFITTLHQRHPEKDHAFTTQLFLLNTLNKHFSKTWWEKKKTLATSYFSFSRHVLYPINEQIPTPHLRYPDPEDQ